jgi:hypothetical protein
MRQHQPHFVPRKYSGTETLQPEHGGVYGREPPLVLSTNGGDVDILVRHGCIEKSAVRHASARIRHDIL